MRSAGCLGLALPWPRWVPLLALLAGGRCLAAHTVPWPLPDGAVAAHLQVRDGAGREVAADWRAAGAGWVGGGRFGQLELTPERAGDAAVWRLTAVNTSAAQQRLELCWAARLSLSAADTRWWDGGFDEQRAVVGEQGDRLSNADGNGYVPLAAVADARDGLWLGLTPDTLSSYARPTLHLAANGDAVFSLTVRLVLEPRQRETVGVCAGRPRGSRYGLMAAAWEAYHRAFPAAFQPTPGVGDHIWGAAAEYQAWAATPPTELMRRLGVTWDWCYTPFRRVGDLLVREGEWQYRPLATPLEGHANSMLGRDYPMAKVTAAQFREDRRRYFDTYGLDHGLMCYQLAWWVEKQLAQAKFADALIVDPRRKTELSSWCRYHDVELAVMPIGTSYEERIVGDMARIAQELVVPGFALDVYVNQQRNYSALVGRTALPGRAWDERGVFQDLGVSLSQLADRLHQLRLSDRPFERLALIGGHGAVGFHTDATLYELTFYGADRKRYPLWRMSMGQKPGVIWQGYDIPNILPNWTKLERREFLRAFSGVADYVRLKCFQWGIYPTWSNLAGVDTLQAELPLLDELIRAGWHPLAPVSVTAPAKSYAWPSRYGADGQYLVVGSPNEAPVAATVTIDNDLLGPGDHLYASRRDDATLPQQVTDRRTVIDVTLPRRGNLVLQSLLAVSGYRGPVTARIQRDLPEVIATAELQPGQPTTVRLHPAALAGATLAQLTVDDQPVQAGQPLTLPAGAHRVAARYRVAAFALTGRQLAEFAFVDAAGQPRFAIVSAHAERRAEARVVSRLRGYFSFWAQQARQHPAPMAAAVVGTPPAAGSYVAVTIGAPTTGWRRLADGRGLALQAASEAEAVRLTDQLLGALDHTYAYRVPFRGGMAGMYQPVQVQHRLIGRTLTQALAEEGL